jgi:hypothetical protein
MGIIDKIKNIFGKKQPVEVTPEQDLESPIEETLTEENKGSPTGEKFFICAGDICSNEATKEFKGNKSHKRCVKKCKKLVFQGLSLEQIQQTLRGEK